VRGSPVTLTSEGASNRRHVISTSACWRPRVFGAPAPECSRSASPTTVCRSSPPQQNTGPTPSLGAPEESLIPTVRTAKAVGWAGGGEPTAAAGHSAVTALARDLDHPRWLYVANPWRCAGRRIRCTPEPDDAKGISGKVHKLVMKRAGLRVSAQRGSHNLAARHWWQHTRAARLYQGSAFADRHGPSWATISTSPTATRCWDLPITPATTEVRTQPTRVAPLPAGQDQPSLDPRVSLPARWAQTVRGRGGSNSNAAENGLTVEAERSSVWKSTRRPVATEFLRQVCVIRRTGMGAG